MEGFLQILFWWQIINLCKKVEDCRTYLCDLVLLWRSKENFKLPMIYFCFIKYVEPTNKRYLLGIDVSGSMTCGGCHGCEIINPREASAAMAMVALRTEPNAIPMAFCKKLVPLAINRDMYLEDVIKKADEVRSIFNPFCLASHFRLLVA